MLDNVNLFDMDRIGRMGRFIRYLLAESAALM